MSFYQKYESLAYITKQVNSNKFLEAFVNELISLINIGFI